MELDRCAKHNKFSLLAVCSVFFNSKMSKCPHYSGNLATPLRRALLLTAVTSSSRSIKAYVEASASQKPAICEVLYIFQSPKASNPRRFCSNYPFPHPHSPLVFADKIFLFRRKQTSIPRDVAKTKMHHNRAVLGFINRTLGVARNAVTSNIAY